MKGSWWITLIDYATKSKIIVGFYQEVKDEQMWKEFIERNDIGIPLAICHSKGYIELKDIGKDIIDETWLDVCKHTLANPDGDYKSVDDILLKFED